MTPEQLRKRMTAFAVDTVNFCKPLWLKPETRYIGAKFADSTQIRPLLQEAASRITAQGGNRT